MAKNVVINGKEEKPIRKINLVDEGVMTRGEIKILIRQKQVEKKAARISKSGEEG